MSVLRSFSVVALLAIMAGSLAACTPKPKLPRVDEPEHRAGQSGLGSFNLQKRHGLGGWDQKPGASERQLLRALSKSGPHPGEPR
ncbi:MAG TPA: hypothetical protein V6C52_11730 [Coleofasciculaceae cyanobacterium]